jgi:hypothetical protein
VRVLPLQLALAAALLGACDRTTTAATTSPPSSPVASPSHSASATHTSSASPTAFPAAVTDGTYEPRIDPDRFTTEIDNAYMPWAPGTSYRFEGDTAYGHETDTVTVTHDTVKILGVTCVVVRDEVQTDGQLAELTFDWYAQDVDGNVWYFGEDSHEYSGGVATSSIGSWKAGVDGAQPGIVMPGEPAIGLRYRQEYLPGEAEDQATILALHGHADVPIDSFDRVLVTKDWSPLEPSVIEHKYYARGIGVVLEELVSGGSERVELVRVSS